MVCQLSLRPNPMENTALLRGVSMTLRISAEGETETCSIPISLATARS